MGSAGNISVRYPRKGENTQIPIFFPCKEPMNDGQHADMVMMPIRQSDIGHYSCVVLLKHLSYFLLGLDPHIARTREGNHGLSTKQVRSLLTLEEGGYRDRGRKVPHLISQDDKTILLLHYSGRYRLYWLGNLEERLRESPKESLVVPWKGKGSFHFYLIVVH